MQLHDDIICKFYDACEKAGIKNPVAFLNSKRHQVYDWLVGVFPYRILPTDIDGLVHLNGYFLLLEFKHEGRVRDGGIPKGQARCFENLSATGRITVWIVGVNDSNDPTCLSGFRHSGEKIPLRDIGREGIKQLCRDWAAWAEKQPTWNEAA